MLCEYFRHGQCTKGFKCKFSHDLAVERKGGKIDVFSDRSYLPPSQAFHALHGDISETVKVQTVSVFEWTKVDCLGHRRLRQGRKIRAAMHNISDYGCGRRKDGDSDEEGMDDWDQDKLDEVVRQKHGTEKNRPTDIICKFFLDAVEKKTYGW